MPPAEPTSSVSGIAATMTIVAMGLGYSITASDPTILSADISEVRAGLALSGSTASFVAASPPLRWRLPCWVPVPSAISTA